MFTNAKRLYIGETLVYDAAGAPSTEIVDIFDRDTLGPEYEVVNTLKTGAAVSAALAERRLTLTGYAPAAVRDFGAADGRIEVVSYNTGAQIVARYVDQDNWVSWSPTDRRVRTRFGGVSYDRSVPTAFSSSGAFISLEFVGDTFKAFQDGKLITTFIEDRLMDAHKHGVGGTAASANNAFRRLVWTPTATAPPTRFFNPAASLAAVDAATTLDQMRDTLAGVASFLGGVASIQSEPGGFAFGSFTVDHPNIREAVKASIRALSRYPAGFMPSWSLTLCRDPKIDGSGGAPVSGVTSGSRSWVGIEPTPAATADVSTNPETLVEFTVHHELAHVASRTFSAPIKALEAQFKASNPPGVTYGGTYTPGNPRPMGFNRGYGATSFEEDQADVMGWLMTPQLRPQMDAWTASDSYLMGKKAAMSNYAGVLNWGSAFFD